MALKPAQHIWSDVDTEICHSDVQFVNCYTNYTLCDPQLVSINQTVSRCINEHSAVLSRHSLRVLISAFTDQYST
jgi:hypothetical protein